MKISAKQIKEIEDLIDKKDQQAFLNKAVEDALEEHKAMNAETIEIFVDGGFTGPAIGYATDHDVAIFQLLDNGSAQALNHAARQVGRGS